MPSASLRRLFVLTLLSALLAAVTVLPVCAQGAGTGNADAGTSIKELDKSKKKDDAAPPKLTDEERKERLRSFRKEVSKSYLSWLEQDVTYIITPEEETAFKLLGNDEERDAFIDEFWQRRNPDPDSEENSYREEHYRRIQYADEHFAAGIPGWKTDRGHIYIVWGAPDEIESHPSGGTYQRESNEGGGTTSTYPFERWRYRHLEGIGENIVIEFVDSCQCNDYHMSLDPNEKDALLHTPGGGPTQLEQMGMGDRTSRITGVPGAMQPNGEQNGANQFEALERFSKLNAPPQLRFPDLEEKVEAHVRYNLMPFEMRADFVRITSDTVLVPITMQINTGDMTFTAKEGVQNAMVNIFGRITTISGRVDSIFEDTVSVTEPADLLPQALLTKQMYWKAVALKPGMYKIDLAIKDVNGNRVGTMARSIRVPDFDEEKLASSSLILADLMEHVAVKSIGSGTFVLGDTKVRPRPDTADGKPAAFQRSQQLNVWMQVYNLQADPQSRKNRATISYDIVNLQSGKSVLHTDEPASSYGTGGDEITIEKTMPLAALEPGVYNLKITVNDQVDKQTITPSARFLVQ